MYQLKTANIYYLTVSEGPESDSSLIGWFGLRVCHEVAVKLYKKYIELGRNDLPGSLT